MRPTVITDVSDDSRIMQEEVFGPVTCIVPFRTEEEVSVASFQSYPHFISNPHSMSNSYSMSNPHSMFNSIPCLIPFHV